MLQNQHASWHFDVFLKIFLCSSFVADGYTCRFKKLKVDDLLKHTRDEKPDLATEIKR